MKLNNWMKSLSLYFSNFTAKENNRNQLEIVVKGTYDLHPIKYFEILSLTFGGRSVWWGVSCFIQIPDVWMRSQTCQ